LSTAAFGRFVASADHPPPWTTLRRLNAGKFLSIDTLVRTWGLRARVSASCNHFETGGHAMNATSQLPVIGLDIAKNVFQLHSVDDETGEIERRKLRRAKVSEFFANRQPLMVAMEACGGAHHWARVLHQLGHQVKLLPPKHVRAFVLRDKTDALDAQAIWVAARQPHIKEVPMKSEQQQACLSLHRIRSQLMKIRIMQTNALRGLLYEFGIVLPEGHNKLLLSVHEALAKAQQLHQVPDVLVLSIQEQLRRIDALQGDIDQLDKRLAAMVKQNQQMLAVQAIPGIGPLSATAIVATATDVAAFKSGRQFAAWLGLTPRQVGTGGKTQQLGISKRGDAYVRSLLIHGARSIVSRSVAESWIGRLKQRRHFNVAVAALANKMARTAWAVLAKGTAFDGSKWAPHESAAT
jgi:transposase